MPDLGDQWAAGANYEKFMGRWSRLLAALFVSWLPVRRGAHWLDVGCGTGALSGAICSSASPASVTACDPSESFIWHAQQRQSDSRVRFVVGGAGNLPRRPGGFDSVTSAFVLNFLPEPERAIEEMCRTAARDGLVSACVWDYAGRMEFLKLFWECASVLDPDAQSVDERVRFPICGREALAQLFVGGRLREVVCEPLEITTRFSNFADFWTPFLGGTGPAPAYVAGLSADQRTALALSVERALPFESDGTISLVARAWAVRGLVS